MTRSDLPARIFVAIFVVSTLSTIGGYAQTPQPAASPKPVQASPAVSPIDPQVSLPLPEFVPNASGTGVTIARATESFSELTVKGSDLHPEPPILGSREQKLDFIRELWQVRWRPNDPIDLWVILPRGVKNPPVVLFLYGFPTETDRFKNDSYCSRVVQGGAAAVGFVSALTGHRYNYRPFKENFISELPEALASTVHDVHLVLDYLQSRGDLDMNRVGMFGQGSGGAIAIMSAAVDPRLKALDLLNPWGDWPDWFATAPNVPQTERANYLKPNFQKALKPLEPLQYLPQLKSQKLRIQFADDGEPEKAISSLQAAAPSSAQVIRFATSRRMYNENSGGRLFEWIAMALNAHPATAPQPNPVAVQTDSAKSKP